MSQKQKILDLLNGGEWHCTSSMYAMYMADPRTILAKLYEKGKGSVEKRWCQAHKHEGSMREWRLKSRLDVKKWNEQFYPKTEPVENKQLSLI